MDETAWRSIDEFAAKKTPLPLALPPVLSWRLFTDDSDARSRRDSETLCALHQWALNVALKQGQGRLTDAEWLAHRYARMQQAGDWWGWPDDPSTEAAQYPVLARRLGIEGRITVGFDVDAQGRFSNAAVVQRDLQVAGIRGQRPVAYETLFDEAGLARLAQLSAQPPPDGRPAKHQVQFVFKLEP